ncbi:MAG: phosphotransferase [Gammaproteobacteria bacterium]|jgi:aminoglycoside/choline kinase family phosphotransferase
MPHVSLIQNWLSSISENIGLTSNFSIQPITGDASLRKYYLVLRNNSCNNQQQFIVMQTTNDDSMKNFINIADYLAELNLSINVPKVFAINNDSSVAYLLLSYLGDQLLFKLLNINTAEVIYKTAWQTLANIQLTAKNISLPLMDRDYIKTNLLLFKTWYLETHLKLYNIVNLDNLLNKLENYFVEIFNSQPQVFVHIDYHSRNLILASNATSDVLNILDFQDARSGPITYDIASLLQDAYLVWPESLTEKILFDYFNYLKYTHKLFKGTFKEFLRYFYLTGLQRHLKNLGIFARLKYLYKKPDYLQHIPNLLNYIYNACNKWQEPELIMLKELILEIEPTILAPTNS